MVVRAAATALLFLGCTRAAPTEPAVEETFTMDTDPASATRPVDDGTGKTLPYGPSPWTGRIERVTHQYWNGCTDRRKVEILALVLDERPVPVILGWRRATPQSLEEPRFLSRREDLPANNACVTIRGAVVPYAYQGIVGAPAYAIAAQHIAPAPCP